MKACQIRRIIRIVLSSKKLLVHASWVVATYNFELF